MEQIQILLEAGKETPIHMMVLFNVLMGLRRQEILGLKYSDIDYINRTISIKRQLGRAVNTKKEDFAPKTFTKQEIKLKTSSSKRELPIPDYVFEKKDAAAEKRSFRIWIISVVSGHCYGYLLFFCSIIESAQSVDFIVCTIWQTF